jgi:glutathione peroxidase
MNVYEYVFHAAGGARMPLAYWEAQPLLLVNTASRCGYAPQLEKLQALYSEYRRANFVVIALPCDDFGEKEPGSEQEILELYRNEHGVAFPITSKIHVSGLEAHPLFNDLLDAYGDDYLPKWNFTKYLFDTEGELVEHWPAKVEPDDPALIYQLERQLKSWVL